MDKAQEGAYFLPAINPKDGIESYVIVNKGRIEATKELGLGRTKELIQVVPEVLFKPRSIWRGVRERRERKWLCYCGIPSHAIDLETAARIPPWPGQVFLVFVTAARVVYAWRWEKADPDDPTCPEDHASRFDEKAL